MKTLPDQELFACSGLSAGYPGRVVLRDLSFSLREGEIVALLGVNGSGKSTLLKTIIASLPVSQGEMVLNGERMEKMSPTAVARKIAYVPQEEHAEFPFTAREVVMMGRLPHSSSLFDSQADIDSAERAMTTADCLHLANRSILELSGGEKQRVLLARALAQGARLLLLDEPTSHLDVKHQVELSSVLTTLSQEGYGVLIAIHDLNLASVMANRAIVLSDGKILLDAPIEKVMGSAQLETAFQVRFERLTGPGGRNFVFPLV